MPGNRLFAILQHGDSLFPGGVTSFSWGLEQLAAEGKVADAAALSQYLEDQLRWRWASFDRPILCAAYRARADLAELSRVDAFCTASIAARELREGSIRAGQALLGVHVKLGTPGAADYRARLDPGLPRGHLPVVQGLVWGGLGFSEREASILSAYAYGAGSAAAAIRLGVIGHVHAQRILAHLAETVPALITAPPPELEDAASFVPATDIAAMRHEVSDNRLFAN
jgi:urease accessory protein